MGIGEIMEDDKEKDDYRIIRGSDHRRQHQFFIRSDDLCTETNQNEIVLLHFEGSEMKHIKLIHDDGDSPESIDIPIDCIDAFIAALTFLKNDDPDLKGKQRKYREAEG
jgi:hypothetical protein